MSNNDNNRLPIKRTHFYDGINVKNTDFVVDQNSNLAHTSYVAHDFHGSGILQSNPVTLPPMLDTANPDINGLSYTTINSGRFDGKGLFVDRQPIDTTYGEQLLVSLKNVKIPLYSQTKVIIFGKIYDPDILQGRPVLETVVFDKSDAKATINYFKSVIAVFINNLSGGIGRTDLSSSSTESLNTSLPGLVGSLSIKEVGPLQVLDYGVIVNQTNMPNLDVQTFITSTITRTFRDEITFAINSVQNISYAPVSLADISLLPLNTVGSATKPFLDSTTNGYIYGQKVYLATNNIQQISFSLSLADDTNGWSGELVLGIRALQTRSIDQFANKLNLDPDINILFEASFTQSDLLSRGYVLTETPQEIKFNFIGTALAQAAGILIPNKYYIITLARRADISTGKILIDVGQKILVDSEFASYNPATRAWKNDLNIDLWFKIYSAAVRVSPGVAYTNDGIMVSLQKTKIERDGTIVSSVAGPYSLATIDASASDNIVILQSSQSFDTPSEHPRTGNLVFSRIIDKAEISVLSLNDFNELVDLTNDANEANFPMVLAVINDLNNKLNSPIAGIINLPGQVRKDQIILLNTGLQDRQLEVNNVIVPNNATTGVRYRIVQSETESKYLGDFNNDKIFTSFDLVEQAIVQDTFSAQSTNTATGTSFDPYSIFDSRSRDAIGFGKETVENFVMADVNSSLTINSDDAARLQYLTTTLPVYVSPAPTSVSIQTLTVENITGIDNPILITQVTNIDGYAVATGPDQLAFTALNVGDMRALSVGDKVDLSADGAVDTDNHYSNPAYSGLLIEKFIQRNELILETRFLSDVLPTVDTSYTLSFYDQQAVFDGKLGVFDEVATEVLEFVVPGIDLIAADILPGDIVKITSDLLGTSRNGEYVISQIINAITFRVESPDILITAGVANAGIEIFTSDGPLTGVDKLDYTIVTGLDIINKFVFDTINLITPGIQEGDKMTITSGPGALLGTYVVARVLSATEVTVVPPGIPLIAQTFTGDIVFTDSTGLVTKIVIQTYVDVELEAGPAPYIASNVDTFAPATLPNNVDTIFQFSLTHIPVTGTATVHWISSGIEKSMTFSAAPVEIAGDGNPANSSINRITGTIVLDTFLPADADTDITTDYRIAPIVTLKHCYPTVVNAVSSIQTDIEFKVPFINPNPNIDIQGIDGAFVIIQTNNAEPPNIVLNSDDEVIAGVVVVNTINSTQAITLPARNVVLQLTDSAGDVADIVDGYYWMQIYSGTRVNLPAIQKEFLSDTLGLSSPIKWTIQRNNFEWLQSDMVITDYRRFLPAAFVHKQGGYVSKNEMWIPSDLYIGNGEILSAPGVPHHGDIEITKINLDLPVTALLSNNINVYNSLIASYAQTPGFTRAGRIAMKFSDGTYVGADDSGNDTDLTKNRVRIMPTLGSIYLDGYQVANAPVYTDLDEVLTKLHYEIRSGMYFDDSSGILYFHMENIKSIFIDEPIIQTGVVKIVIDVGLKKSTFINEIVSIGAADIGRLFTSPVNIIPTPKFSIAGEIVAGFIVGVSS